MFVFSNRRLTWLTSLKFRNQVASHRRWDTSEIISLISNTLTASDLIIIVHHTRYMMPCPPSDRSSDNKRLPSGLEQVIGYDVVMKIVEKNGSEQFSDGV